MNKNSNPPPETEVAIFKGKEIGKTIHNNEWWFSIADVISVLTDGVDVRQYIKKCGNVILSWIPAGVQFVPRLNCLLRMAKSGKQIVLIPEEYSASFNPSHRHMLGEAATTEITRNRNAQGFIENQDTARRGGKIAGDARKKLEKESGRKVVTSENYLGQPEVVERIG
jgi:hypothetical protein